MKRFPGPSRLEFLEKFLANNSALSDAGDNSTRLLNRGFITDLPLLRTLLAIGQMSRDRRFCFTRICKFGNFKNPFAMITSLSELHFRLGRLVLL